MEETFENNGTNFILNNCFLSFASKEFSEIFSTLPATTSRYYFEFKRIPDISCPVCGKIMTTRDEMLSFISVLKKATGKNLIDELNKYEDRTRGVERKVFSKLKYYAKRNKDKNLKELFIILYRNSIKQLENSQKKVLAKIVKLKDGLEGETLERVSKDILHVNRLLRKRKNTQSFKRKTFIAGFYKLISEEENPRNKKILELITLKAKKLPTSGNSFDAFVVKYHRRSIDEIAQRLLDASLSSTEHIKPRSNGGENNPANYLVQCKFCNSERSSMSYNEWLRKHPEMKHNLQIHIDKIVNLIINEEIEGYDFYPLIIKCTLAKESNGALDFNIDKYLIYIKFKYFNNNISSIA